MTSDPGFVGRRLLLIGMISGLMIGAGVVLSFLGFRWWWCSVLGVGLVLLVDRLGSSGRTLDPFTWARGHAGESYVSLMLRDLEPLGYRIVEHVDIGRGDVDHVVVGPTGVFAIETKNWPGRVEEVEGRLLRSSRSAQPYVAQAVRNAIAIRERTGVRWVEAILVCVNANVVGDPIVLGPLTIVSASRLNALITDRRDQLSLAGAQGIVDSLTTGDKAGRRSPTA